MSQFEIPEDALTAATRQFAPSLLGGDPVVMPVSSSYSMMESPMSPGDAAELLEQATRLAAIYRQPLEEVLESLKAVLEWDYRLKSANEPQFDSEGNVIEPMIEVLKAAWVRYRAEEASGVHGCAGTLINTVAELVEDSNGPT